MQMTNAEIVREYKEAKSKREQIQILADLNLCTKKEIKAILKEAGIDTELKKDTRGRKKKITPVQQETNEEPEKKGTVPQAVIDAVFDKMVELEEKITATSEEMQRLSEDLEDFEREYGELATYIN